MNQSKQVVIGLLVALVLVGCGGGQDDESVQGQRSFSRVDAPWAYTDLSAEYVVVTSAGWNRTWHLHEPVYSPARPPVSIDFAVNMVVGLTRGTGPSGCDTLEIKRVLETSQQIEVEYEQSRPPQGAICTGALNALTDFVITAKSVKPVVFVRPGGSGG